jgi:hypothetical protein
MYSSVVFEVMVVVVLVESHACVYVAVVEIVRHALHEVMPTQTIAINTNKSLFIFLFVLVNKFRDFLAVFRIAYEHASFRMFGLSSAMNPNPAPSGHVTDKRHHLLEPR